MTPEQKLEKVEELLAARDEITAELLELMGEEVDDEEKEEKKEKEVAGKKQRKCSVCGKPGHTAQSCKKNKAENYGHRARSSAGCPECGSISKHKAHCSRPLQTAKRALGNPCNECRKVAKHAKWCSRYEQVERANRIKKEIDDSYGRMGAMSKTNFERVKTAASLDIPADTISNNLTVSLQEVNKAIIAGSYDDYAGVSL